MEPKFQKVKDTYLAYEGAQKALNEAVTHSETVTFSSHPKNFDWKQLVVNLVTCKSEYEAAINDSIGD